MLTDFEKKILLILLAASVIEWYLNTYDNKQDVLDAVDNIVYMTGGTNTWLALDDLVDISFQVSCSIVLDSALTIRAFLWVFLPIFFGKNWKTLVILIKFDNFDKVWITARVCSVTCVQ